MSERIRQIEQDDLPEISRLFEGRKSVEELNWLFENPDRKNTYNGFVALNSREKICGVIGFVRSEYRQIEHSVFGVIPVSWKVEEGYKGFAGIQLMRKIMENGDFAIAISGSSQAFKLYRVFHLDHHSNVDTYFRLLRPAGFFHSMHKNILKRSALTLLLLPSYLDWHRKNRLADAVTFEPYDGNNYVPEKPVSPSFRKVVSKNQLDWMLRCPCVDAYAFNVYYNTEPLGFCVFYTVRTNRILRGRIVHFPCLDHELDVWKALMLKTTLFFHSIGCCSFTAIGHDDSTGIPYKKVGFSSVRRHRRPVYIRDKKGVLRNFDLSAWNIQYDEGDKAYREI